MHFASAVLKDISISSHSPDNPQEGHRQSFPNPGTPMSIDLPPLPPLNGSFKIFTRLFFGWTLIVARYFLHIRRVPQNPLFRNPKTKNPRPYPTLNPKPTTLNEFENAAQDSPAALSGLHYRSPAHNFKERPPQCLTNDCMLISSVWEYLKRIFGYVVEGLGIHYIGCRVGYLGVW